MRSNKLSPREKEIAELVIKGFCNKEIAEKLNIALNSVRTRLSLVYIKLGLTGTPNPRKLLKEKELHFL